MNDFLNPAGILKPIHSRLKRDHTLMLAIRNGYVNIYYRGGNILKITEQAKGYQTSFNNRYKSPDSERTIPQSPQVIINQTDAHNWVDSFAERKIIMDDFFAKKGKSEREFQQLIARENNNKQCKG